MKRSRKKDEAANLAGLLLAVHHSYTYDREWTWAQEYTAQCELSCEAAAERARKLRRRILRRLISGIEIGDSYERFNVDPAPLIQRREGGKLLLVIYDHRSGGTPSSRDDLEKNCILVILDDPAGGVA